MIAQLSGTIVGFNRTALTVDVHGVGYRVIVSPDLYAMYHRVHDTQDGPVVVLFHTHLDIHENDWILYGFQSEKDLHFFNLVRSVTKIGCKTALVITSVIEQQEFYTAISSGDIQGLSRIPGIGKKTAERIILELKDKIPNVEGATPKTSTSQVEDDAISGLQNLGYKKTDVKSVVKDLANADPTITVEDLITQVLQKLTTF